jgi:succinyl-diaminopimelate desuccinylase
VKALLEQLQGKNPDFKYNMEDLMIVQPVQTDPKCELVTAISESTEQIFGRPPELAASPGTYDQKHVVRVGNVQQCIAYGPGILDQAHLPDEYVLVEDVITSAKVMALTALRLLGTE